MCSLFSSARTPAHKYLGESVYCATIGFGMLVAANPYWKNQEGLRYISQVERKQATNFFYVLSSRDPGRRARLRRLALASTLQSALSLQGSLMILFVRAPSC